MSEYAMQRPAPTPDPEKGPTLFDDETFNSDLDAAIEHTVDTQGISYDEARRIHGVETPQYETPHPTLEVDPSQPTPGVSVDLGVRAVAIATIMDAYNQLNKNMGVTEARQKKGNDFDARYSKPDKVRKKMDIRAASKLRIANIAYKNMIRGADLVAQGFAPEDVNRVDDAIRETVLNAYGPGKAYAEDREKVVRKVSTTARRANGAKR